MDDSTVRTTHSTWRETIMSICVTENVMSILATLGFQADLMDTELELVIDQFDTWKNSEYGMMTTTGCCRAEFLE
jgi:hypothetical protein